MDNDKNEFKGFNQKEITKASLDYHKFTKTTNSLRYNIYKNINNKQILKNQRTIVEDTNSFWKSRSPQRYSFMEEIWEDFFSKHSKETEAEFTAQETFTDFKRTTSGIVTIKSLEKDSKPLDRVLEEDEYFHQDCSGLEYHNSDKISNLSPFFESNNARNSLQTLRIASNSNFETNSKVTSIKEGSKDEPLSYCVGSSFSQILTKSVECNKYGSSSLEVRNRFKKIKADLSEFLENQTNENTPLNIALRTSDDNLECLDPETSKLELPDYCEEINNHYSPFFEAKKDEKSLPSSAFNRINEDIGNFEQDLKSLKSIIDCARTKSPFLDAKKEENVPIWIPPRSPHNLIEESLYYDPWALLVATIFLNKTSCKAARPYVFWFLQDYPDPFSVLNKKPSDLERYFVNLGLQKTRSIQVWRMSHDFLYKNWKKVTELYGVGKYGEEAFRMFCLGDFNLEPTDRFLRIYKAWYEMEEKKLRMEEMNC